MTRTAFAILGLLGALPACVASDDQEQGADTDDTAAVELQFESESPLLPDFDLDTGWQPADGPAGVRLILAAGGGVNVQSQGRVDGEQLTGIEGSGSVSLEGELLVELSARISTAGIEYEGVLESLGYAIPQHTHSFDPFAVGEAVRVQTELPPGELGTVPIPSVPGASVQLDIAGGTIDTTYETTCARSDGDHAQVTGDLTMGGRVELAATILVEIPVVGTETFGPFEIEAPIPEVTHAIDLGTRDVKTGESTEDQGVCTNGDPMPDPTNAGGSTSGPDPSDTLPADDDDDGDSDSNGDSGSSTGGDTDDASDTSPNDSDVVVFIEFDGVSLVPGAVDDAPNNVSTLVKEADLSPFDEPTLEPAILARVQEAWAPLGVTITDERPQSGPFTMVIVTPTPVYQNIGGIAPPDCGNENPNSVGLVFWTDNTTADEYAKLVSWVAGVSMGLDPGAARSPDLMGGGDEFLDQCTPLQNDPVCPHVASCLQGEQNTFAELWAATH